MFGIAHFNLILSIWVTFSSLFPLAPSESQVVFAGTVLNDHGWPWHNMARAHGFSYVSNVEWFKLQVVIASHDQVRPTSKTCRFRKQFPSSGMGPFHDHPMIEICLADWAPRAPGCRNRCFGRHGGIVAIWRPPKSGKSLREGRSKCDMYDLYVTTITYFVI